MNREAHAKCRIQVLNSKREYKGTQADAAFPGCINISTPDRSSLALLLINSVRASLGVKRAQMLFGKMPTYKTGLENIYLLFHVVIYYLLF